MAGSTTTNLVTAWPGMTDRDLQELLNESTDEVREHRRPLRAAEGVQDPWDAMRRSSYRRSP